MSFTTIGPLLAISYFHPSCFHCAVRYESLRITVVAMSYDQILKYSNFLIFILVVRENIAATYSS